ncbi:hypothetical protein DQG13_09100 [Paenibacillus sp. YN15]|nr:hypothetical protein DQG13_09100 [Paenibacillus sp. YN15]
MAAFPLFRPLGPDSSQDHVHPPPLHAIDAPRSMIQEIRRAAKMAITLGRLLDLRDILTSGAENDAMDEGKQMIQLRF